MNTQLQWYAVYVKSRNEKKVAERFEARGLACYCPLHTVTRQWSDRRKKVREPLFKSYVFVQSNTSTRLTVLQTPGVVGFVNWLGRPAVIRNSEIDAIRIFLEDYDQVAAVAHASYHEGQMVEVKYGPMCGSQGQVLRQKKHKLVLRIEQLGLDLVAELPKSHLEHSL